MSQYVSSPETNLDILRANPYPGRLLVVGYYDDVAIIGYCIGGRSAGSQNRILDTQDNIVSTAPHDPGQGVGDPELTIYDAIRRFDDSVVVSNGNQTDTFGRYLRCGKSFEDAAITLLYEPDSPNYTPRISGFVEIGQKVAGISIVKKVGDEAIHKTWRYDTLDGNELPLHDGIGRAIHTYQGEDSGILSPYNEDPFVLPLMGNAEDMANLLWNSLNPDTRVAVAVMAFSLTNQDVQIHTINKHTQVNV